MPYIKTFNSPLKDGFIFIPIDGVKQMDIKPSHRLKRMGGLGHFGKLSYCSVNGWVPVTVEEYEGA